MADDTDTIYMLESTQTGDAHRAYLEHLAEKYLDRALDEYEATRANETERQRTVIAMINSLADRFQMIEARAKHE